MRFTLQHFFRALKLASIFWPYTGKIREQIQSYAVLTMMDDINGENLGQYQDKKATDYFYSRKWAELQYNPSEFSMQPPYLIAFEPDSNGTIENPFYQQRSKTQYTLNLYIVDAFKDLDIENIDSAILQPEDFMTIEDMYLEGERKLKALFAFLESEVVIASLDGGSYTVYTEGYLERIVAESFPALTYVIDSLATARYREMLTAQNENVTFSRWSGGANDLHGVRATINIMAYCEEVPAWDYTKTLLDEVIQDHDAGQVPEAAPLLLDLDGPVLGGGGGSLGGL